RHGPVSLGDWILEFIWCLELGVWCLSLLPDSRGSGFSSVTATIRLASMPETLVINEIYLSIQGESTFAGLPCVFLRLTACNLRCSYCDTAYAFAEGKKMSIPEILSEIDRIAAPFKKIPGIRVSNSALPLVELTGGEPL